MTPLKGPPLAADQLSQIVDAIIGDFEAANQVRDQTLARSRELIRACAHSIRAIHRHELASAAEMLSAARSTAAEMVAPLAPHPDLYHAGYTQDALKELVEAHLVFAFVTGGELPRPAALHVAGPAYLKGLAEAATEMRRFALDLMRRGEVAAAEPYLTVMDDIYSLLVTVDFPDAVTGGLRRQTDVLRSVLERTRGDLTMAVRQDQMRLALHTFEERLGIQTLGGDDLFQSDQADQGEDGDG